jgi:hypothetical protein
VAEMKPTCLRCHAKVAPAGRHASRRTARVVQCYTINSSTKNSGDDDDIDSLKYFNALHASYSFCNIFCVCYVFDVICRLIRIVIGVLFNPNQ